MADVGTNSLDFRNVFGMENLHREFCTVTECDTDGSGDVTITFTGLRQLRSISDVKASVGSAGIKATCISISANVAVIRCFIDKGSAGLAVAHATQTNIGTLVVEAFGY